MNTIRNLVDQTILLLDDFYSSNIEVVKTILQNNCYPIKTINKQINKRLKVINKRLKVIKDNRITNKKKKNK